MQHVQGLVGSVNRLAAMNLVESVGITYLQPCVFVPTLRQGFPHHAQHAQEAREYDRGID